MYFLIVLLVYVHKRLSRIMEATDYRRFQESRVDTHLPVTRIPFYCSSVCLVGRKPQLRNISMMVVYDRRGGVNRCKLARRLPPSPLDEQVTVRSRQRTYVRLVLSYRIIPRLLEDAWN